MKTKFLTTVYACIIAIVALTGCEKEYKLDNARVSEVKNLFAPEDGANVFIGGTGSVTFEWEQARAEDNGVVLYEVVFDKPDGDFSQPLYSVPSDGKGMKNSLTISYADLTKVASAAGIPAAQMGQVKWTVRSSRGINVQASTVSNILELERPDGFAAPASAYLTGSATEGGDDLSKAVPFKKIADGEFEVYTSLKNGKYQIATRNTGNPELFSINEQAKLVENGETEITDGTKVYRIRVNFNNATTEISEIVSLGLWFAPDDKIWFELPYAGNSSWEIKSASVVFKQESWGRDERYKFRFIIKDASGAQQEEWFGSTKGDNQRPNSSTEASYWYMVPVSNDRWNNCFKFDGNVDNKNADIKVTFNPAAYTHTVTVN